jgi:DNA modification methylase
MAWQLLQGDCLEILKTLPGESAHCCVTSPPYWGLRDYGFKGQYGLEPTPEEYVAKMVKVFREVRRVLRNDGTLWLNLGDSYAKEGISGMGDPTVGERNLGGMSPITKKIPPGFKRKDMIGIPWRVAFALQADGWWLRSDIIWSKTNPMPESVTDRPTKSHEYIFLLTKSGKYYYDAEAIKEPAAYAPDNPANNWQRESGKMTTCHIPGQKAIQHRADRKRGEFGGKYADIKGKEAFRAIRQVRNKRTVWEVATQPYPEAHFATFPGKLITPCILAGCPGEGIALDPFAGSGKTLEVAEKLGRNSIGIEIKPEYCDMTRRRMERIEPSLFEGGAI